MKIEVETDKRINIYRLWEGRQIILCKEQNKYSQINAEEWICLWPSRSKENQMIKREKPIEPVEFLPSIEGNNYLKQIFWENRKNNYIAKVVYFPINGRKRELWENLEKIGEFVLWDIDLGPMKYFEKKGSQYLAIYRVYEINYTIKTEDIIPDKKGNLPAYFKRLNEKASNIIIENLEFAKPVLTDQEFKKRNESILEVIKDYPPNVHKRKYKHKSPNKINLEELNQKKTNLSVKYCIFCGEKLPYEAIYCYSCGKMQSTIP